MYEKRKNDGRGFPRWIFWIALGFILGLLVSNLLQPSRFETVTVFSPPVSASEFDATATAIIQEATRLAQPTDLSLTSIVADDPHILTATALVAEVTQAAVEQDSLYLTATALIAGATQTAAAGQ